MQATTPIPRPFLLRARGLLLLAALVLAGMGTPAVFKIMVPRLEARRDRILAAAPTEPEGRLARWFEFGQPQLHHAVKVARFSEEKPWFVTHVVLPEEEGGAPEVWGIDLSDFEPGAVVRDGLCVRVVLPAPELQERAPLFGDKALGVAVYRTRDGRAPAVDGRELALGRLVPYLARVARGLEKDIEGAYLEVEVGGLRR